MATGERRMTWLGALILAPAVIAAAMLAVMETWRAVDGDAPLFGGPAPRSLAESIAGGYGVEDSYVFIRQGQDPNALFAFRHPDLTEEVEVQVSPLLLAIAARDSSAVRMLFTFGARLDRRENRSAPCLARELANEEIITILESQDGALRVECAARAPAAPTPLVAWAYPALAF